MALTYKSYSAEDYKNWAELIKNGDNTKPDYSFEQISEFLFTTPCDRLKKQMGEETLKNIILNLAGYYGTEQPSERNFEYYVFHYYYKNLDLLKGEKNFENMFKTMRVSYNQARADEIKKTKNRKTVNSAKKKLAEYADDIDTCVSALASGNRTLRGSSDAYKEMERELKELSSIIKNGDTNVDRAYASIMMKALAEKADQYVNDRARTELEHSAGGYKGKRIAAMRRVSAILKTEAERIDENLRMRVEEMEKADREKLKEKLKEKLGSMTFSGRIFFEIKSLGNDYYNYRTAGFSMNEDEKKLELMNKAFRKHVVPFDECVNAFNKSDSLIQNFTNNIKGFVEKNNNSQNKITETFKATEKDYIRWAEMYGLEHGVAELDNLMFTEKKPQFITENAYENQFSIVCGKECLRTQMKAMGIPTRERKPAYPEYYKDSTEVMRARENDDNPRLSLASSSSDGSASIIIGN